MTWKTHLAVGVNALWVAPFFGPISQSILVLLPAAALASLLPDIDASSAKIHYIGGGVLGIFKGSFYGKYFHHRGLMHSFAVAALFFIILWLFFRSSLAALPYVFFLSYFSHPVIDGFNAKVGYLYPFVQKRFALLPKSLRSPVGGVIDNLLFFIALLFFLLFLAAVKDQLIPPAPLPL